MSDIQIPQAIRVIGTSRAAWQWQGKCYTASGVLIPPAIMREDDSLITDNIGIPTDEEVLGKDRVATLPLEALPPGASLTTLEGDGMLPRFDDAPVAASQVAAVDDIERQVHKRELAERDEQIRALQAQMDSLIAEQTKKASDETHKGPDPIGDAIGKAQTKK